mmetsp:Transcript_1251/g.2435  ORF Transcript_1251/g.2435 Transcript_1251/m.2435 type:complete len:143 (-) Transcript_1251:334-762(-)
MHGSLAQIVRHANDGGIAADQEVDNVGRGAPFGGHVNGVAARGVGAFEGDGEEGGEEGYCAEGGLEAAGEVEDDFGGHGVGDVGGVDGGEVVGVGAEVFEGGPVSLGDQTGYGRVAVAFVGRGGIHDADGHVFVAAATVGGI